MFHVAADAISFAAVFLSHLSPILPRLLSKSNPLRWASIWFRVQTWKTCYLSCFDVSRRSSVRIAPTSFYIHSKTVPSAQSAKLCLALINTIKMLLSFAEASGFPASRQGTRRLLFSFSLPRLLIGQFVGSDLL